MKTLNYFSRAFSAIRNFRAKGNGLPLPINELIHPRFGLTTSGDKETQKKVPNSLLFLMYSKENENLFI